MKITSTLILFIFNFLNIFSQSYMNYIVQAIDLANEKKFDESVAAFSTAFEKQDGSWRTYYFAANSAALCGNNEQSLIWLNQSIEQGFCDLETIENSPYLDILRKDDEWNLIVERVKSKYSEENEELSSNFISIISQNFISASNINAFEKIMLPNHPKLMEMKNIAQMQDSIEINATISVLENYGWFNETYMGSKANANMFSILIKADLSVQEKYLPFLQKAYNEKRVDPQYFAILTDIIQLGKGEKQIYGTILNRNQDFEMYVRPLQDPQNLDERRSKLELQPMDIYLKYWNLSWNLEKYEKELPKILKFEKTLDQKNSMNLYQLYWIVMRSGLQFPGCEVLKNEMEIAKCTNEKISAHVNSKFKMKYLSLNQNIISTHKIFVYFKIDEFGKITDIKTYGTENEFEEEAKRVVLALPRLNPVKIYGINKAYIYSLPITFKIED